MSNVDFSASNIVWETIPFKFHDLRRFELPARMDSRSVATLIKGYNTRIVHGDASSNFFNFSFIVDLLTEVALNKEIEYFEVTAGARRDARRWLFERALVQLKTEKSWFE